MDFTFEDRPDNERIQATLRSAQSDSDPEITSLFLDFQWTYREMQKAYDQVLARHGLSESKFILLMFLDSADNHRLQPSDLATKLGATRATVSKMLVGMENAHLVEKIHDQEDKRMVLIELTATGSQVLQDFLPENFQAVGTLFADLTKTDRETLIRLFAKVKVGTKKLQAENEEK